MDTKTGIAVLGGGNLGTALAEGWGKEENSTDNYNITVTRRNVGLIKYLEELNISVTDDNSEAVKQSEILVLAVQPTQLSELLEEIKQDLDPERHILVSAITGVTDKEIAALTGRGFPIIRVMPNTAAAINESMTCIEETPHKEAEKEIIQLFEGIGKTLVIKTELMEAATVLGACGIAFFLRYIRAASQGGIEVGFHAEEAQLIAMQTAIGASSLLLQSNGHPEQEIDKVTTPKGCTIAGLNEMEHYGLSSALIKGIKTSYEKIAKIQKDEP